MSNKNKYIRKTFKKEFLLDMGLPGRHPTGATVISDEVIDTGRWNITYELIVHFDDQPEGEAWSMSYSVGATECQDETPWEYEDEVEAVLVREKEVLVKKWLPVDEVS